MKIECIVDYIRRSGDTHEEFARMMEQDYELLEFDNENGWIQYRVDGDTFYIGTFYLNPKRKCDRKMIYNAIGNFAREKGATKICMVTKRNPEAWKRKFGFTVKSYVMERRL